MLLGIPPQLHHTVSRQDRRQHSYGILPFLWENHIRVLTDILSPHRQCGPIEVAFEIAKARTFNPHRGLSAWLGPKFETIFTLYG